LERLPNIEKTLLDQEGGIQWMDDTANLKTNFQTLIDRVRAAERGHSGLFSNVKVDTEELEKLYAFDEAMLDYVDDLAARIDVLQQAAFSNAEIQEAIIRFDSLLRVVSQAFDLRKQVMIGLVGEEDQPDEYPL
jgi:hypothetical protein